MKIIYPVILIFLCLTITGCYTKNDLIQRQISRDKYKVTTITTKNGEKFNFNYKTKLLSVKGDFLEGALTDGTYMQIPISDISAVNEIPFETGSSIYLYAIFGIGFLAAIWFAATK